jgi:ketosteroid isomerase-like protein
MTHIAPDAESVVQSYHDAWTSGDVDRALALVSDDVRCFAPDERVTTKAEWREYLASFVPMMTGAPELTRMSDGNRVALWYFPQTAVTTTTLASELFVVEDGQIVEIRLAFDRLGYMPRDRQPA